jgi:hypothetical protein
MRSHRPLHVPAPTPRDTTGPAASTEPSWLHPGLLSADQMQGPIDAGTSWLEGLFDKDEEGVTGLEQFVQDHPEILGNIVPGGRLLSNDFGSDRRNTYGDPQGAHAYHQPGNATVNGVDLGETGVQYGANSAYFSFGGLTNPFGEVWGDGSKTNIATWANLSQLDMTALLNMPRMGVRSDDNRLGDTDHNTMFDLGIGAGPPVTGLADSLPTVGARRQTDGVMEVSASGLLPIGWATGYLNVETQDPVRSALDLAALGSPRALPDGNLTDHGLGALGMDHIADYWMGRDTDLSAADVGHDALDAARSIPPIAQGVDALGAAADGLGALNDILPPAPIDIGGLLPFGRDDDTPAKAMGPVLPRAPSRPAAQAPHGSGMSYDRAVRPSAAPSRRVTPVAKASRRGGNSFF